LGSGKIEGQFIEREVALVLAVAVAAVAVLLEERGDGLGVARGGQVRRGTGDRGSGQKRGERRGGAWGDGVVSYAWNGDRFEG